MLLASLVEDGVSLSAILGEVGVDEVDEVVPDGSSEDSREGVAIGCLGVTLGGVD